MKSDNKTLLFLLALFLLVLVLGAIMNLIISFAIALSLAYITSWFGSDVLMSHLPGLTVATFILYTFVVGAIQINVGKSRNE